MQDVSRYQQSPPSPRPSSIEQTRQCTVFIRLPFPRNTFVDPPPVQWNAVKDQALWKIISQSNDTGKLDWQDIAARFDVGLDLLMQHAAWLYERHFAGVRKQMQHLASIAGPQASPTPRLTTNDSSPATGAHSTFDKTDHKDQRSSQSSRAGEALPVATPRPDIARTPSSATITQSRLFTSAQTIAQRSTRGHVSPHDASDSATTPAMRTSATASHRMMESQTFRRAPLARRPDLNALSSEEEGESQELGEDDQNSSESDLPFATVLPHKKSAVVGSGASAKHASRDEAAVISSTSSTASTIPTQSTTASGQAEHKPSRPGALSPKHRAQLTRLSQKGRHGDNSDGAPSMGSSFSDLDDTGISASAIEDAVMQAGGISIASRVSGLSQAFRSQR